MGTADRVVAQAGHGRVALLGTESLELLIVSLLNNRNNMLGLTFFRAAETISSRLRLGAWTAGEVIVGGAAKKSDVQKMRLLRGVLQEQSQVVCSVL